MRNLSVAQPDSCAVDASGDMPASIDVRAISSGRLTYNGVERTASGVKNACGALTIESEEK